MISSDYYLKNFSNFLDIKEIEDDLNFFDLEKDFNFAKSIDSIYDYKQNSLEDEIKAWRKFYINNSSKTSYREFDTNITTGDIADFIKEQLDIFKTRGQVKLSDYLFQSIDKKVNALTNLPDAETFIEMIDLSETSIKLLSDSSVRRLTRESLREYKKLPRSEGFERTLELVTDVLGQLPDNKATRLIQEKMAKLAGVRNFQVLSQATKLTSEIAKNISNPYIKEGFLSAFQESMFGASQNMVANDIAGLIRISVNRMLDRLDIRKDGITIRSLVDFIFDVGTEYNLSFIPKEVDLLFRMKERWKEFVRNSFFNGETITPKNLFNEVLGVFDDVRKDLFASNNIFKFSFQESLFKAINNKLSPLDFNTEIRKKVRDYGRFAFRNAITSYGLDPSDYYEIERIAITALNKTAGLFLNKLTSAIVNKTMSTSQAILMSEKWNNRVLSKFFEYGRLAVDRDGLYEWVFGDTNHCPTCLKANGQRHRLKDWWNAGIIPQNHGKKNIICMGFHCKCRLVRVTGRAIGRLDRIPVAS